MKTIIQLLMIALVLGTLSCIQPDHMRGFQPVFQEMSDTTIEAPKRIETNPPVLLPANSNKIDLSIEQSVMFALHHNQELQIQQLQPVITGTFEQIERGIYDPEWFANAFYLDNREEKLSTDTQKMDITDEREIGLSVGIRQSLPSGTKIEMAMEKNRSSENNDPETHKTRIGLNITQSLLKGYGSYVHLASVKIAELDTVATEFELSEFTQSLVAETEIAYWQYVLAKQKIKIFKQSLAIAKQQRNEIEQQISIGILPENEAAAARAEVALREQALINVSSIMETARLNLLKLIGSDPECHFDIVINPISQPDITAQPITDIKDRLKLAEKLRPDLNEARLRLKQNRLEIIITRNGILPKLDLFINFGRTGYADSFSDSFKNIDNSTYNFTAGFEFRHFLGNRESNSKHNAAKLKRQQAINAISNLKKIVHFDIRQAINELEHARKQISATRMTLMYQKQTAKAEKARFNVGATTALMVSQAYRDLLAARNSEIEAIINYRIAMIKLYIAEGSLLERRGLKLLRNGRKISSPIPGT